jgi:hypothetical protein
LVESGCGIANSAAATGSLGDEDAGAAGFFVRIRAILSAADSCLLAGAGSVAGSGVSTTAGGVSGDFAGASMSVTAALAKVEE